MPLTDLGVSFNPGQRMAAPGMGARQTSVQEPVKVLSMRMPKVFGSRAPSPPSLLTGAGGMGQWGGGGNLVAQALAMLAGLQAPQAGRVDTNQRPQGQMPRGGSWNWAPQQTSPTPTSSPTGGMTISQLLQAQPLPQPSVQYGRTDPVPDPNTGASPYV